MADFCEETLNTCMGGSSGTVLVSSVQAGQTTILHILGFMKDTIRYFSKAHLKVCRLVAERKRILHFVFV